MTLKCYGVRRKGPLPMCRGVYSYISYKKRKKQKYLFEQEPLQLSKTGGAKIMYHSFCSRYPSHEQEFINWASEPQKNDC